MLSEIPLNGAISSEVEDLLEPRVCKLRVALRSRLLRGVYAL